MKDFQFSPMKNKTAIALYVMLLMALPLMVYSADNAPSDPFQPTVTREESELLDQAMMVSNSNTLEAIQILIQNQPKDASPAIDFAIGNLHFQENHLAEAITAYEAALAKLPKFRAAIMNLGRVYLLQERTNAAIKLYQELVKDGQADADILLLLGHALLMEDAPVSAESAYRQSLLLRLRDPDAMLGLAKALMQQERYPEGLALVGEILKEDPTNQELWTLQGNAYLSMGEHTQAMKTIEKARRLGVASPEMLATLGDVLLNREQPEDALLVYNEAFSKKNPSLTRMLRAVEGFLIVGDTTNAQEMLTRIESLPSDSQQVESKQEETTMLRLKAELAQQKGDINQAISLCKDILTQDPLDGRTMLILAELQLQTGELEAAVMTCERAARVEGFEADALIQQAQIEVQRERYQRAATLLEAAQTFENRTYVGRYLQQITRMIE